MRDLLYLSESKMRVLTPQLRRYARRLGIEAGINTGIVSVKGTRASSAGEPQPSSLEMLDAVIEMIEKMHGQRSRTDVDLQPGDWIKFTETFNYGQAEDEEEFTGPNRLVAFAAAASPPLVLLTSAKHILEIQLENPEPEQPQRSEPFYLNLLMRQCRSLLEPLGGGAMDSFDFEKVFYAAWQLCQLTSGGWSSEWTLSPFLVAASSGLGEEALAGEASEAGAGDV
ncbi:SAVMC3_10250 family protein, partial [Streptomyces canus]|uniref:SAVMC3_10250 family protein n=1 Tax=Streptomyces canus TaxID=58343 RepID=UPI0036CA0293